MERKKKEEEIGGKIISISYYEEMFKRVNLEADIHSKQGEGIHENRESNKSEVSETLKRMQRGKSFGPDGIPF